MVRAAGGGHPRRADRMRSMKHFSIALATFVCLAVSALAPAAPAPQPSPEAAQADFAAGDYPACLRKVASLLSSNTVPAIAP